MDVPKISVIGSLNVDLVTRTARIPEPGETLKSRGFSIGFGGKGANQAVACARLSRSKSEVGKPSVDVRMVGVVGSDLYAGDFLESLQKDGIQTDHIQRLEGEKTGTAVIIVEEDTGENRILFSPGANYAVRSEGLVAPDTDVAVLQLEMPLDTVLRSIEQLKQIGSEVVFNPAPAVPLPDGVYNGLGHLVVNETEAAILSDKQPEDITPSANLTEVAEIFIKRGVQNVIITLGGQGVFYHTAKLSATSKPGSLVPALKVKVVDTTAAGDTFLGAYACALAQSKGKGFNIAEAIDFANRAASITVQRPGAQAAIPWADEVS
ncbi:Ribokinase-like protein [Lineolata rhizophorae]|uniref:Ribokinase n=1 Tax=Lineolata rhizophorae TaxID=578093 RepID=A0A6A6NVE6_9PEZI|nr:Ribokinase-like protein [Lineolata rhizophorae]